MSSGISRLALPILLAATFSAGAADDGYVEQIDAQRARQDVRTREGKTTPFTPVDLRMVAPGEQKTVAVCDGVVEFDPIDLSGLRITAGVNFSF